MSLRSLIFLFSLLDVSCLFASYRFACLEKCAKRERGLTSISLAALDKLENYKTGKVFFMNRMPISVFLVSIVDITTLLVSKNLPSVKKFLTSISTMALHKLENYKTGKVFYGLDIF